MRLEDAGVWYFTIKGETMGPVSGEGLRQRATIDLHPRSDMVWGEGMESWIPAGEVDGLFPSQTPIPEPPVAEARSASLPVSQAATGRTSAADLASPSYVPDSPRIHGARLVLFSLVAVPVLAVGWAGFWLLYDFAWSFVPPTKSSVRLPWIVLVFIFCGFGYGLGKPLGYAFRASGFGDDRDPRLLISALIAVAVVIGEIAYSACILAILHLPIHPVAIVNLIVEPLLAEDFTGVLIGIAQLLLRLLLAIGAWAGAASVMGSNRQTQVERSIA